MANKKRLFKDNPKGDSYGQYTFLENNFFDDYKSSDSVPIIWDKFLDRDLYTTSEDNIVNLNIINSMIEAGGISNNYLRYNQDTFMRIDEIILMRRPGILYGIKNIKMKVFMFSAYAVSANGLHDDREFRSPYILDENGNETLQRKTWNQYWDDLWRTTGDADAWPEDPDNHRDPGEIAILMNQSLPAVGQTAEGSGLIPQMDNYVFLTSLTQQNPDYPIWDDTDIGGNFYPTPLATEENHHNINAVADNHLSAFMKKPLPGEDDGEDEEEGDGPAGGPRPIPRPNLGNTFAGGVTSGDINPGQGLPVTQNRNSLTEIFQEDGQYNPIYIVVDQEGHASVPGGGNDYARKNRMHVYKINQNDLFDFDNEGNVLGKETTFEFGENDGFYMDEIAQQGAVAQTITSLKVTISTLGFGGAELDIPSDYIEYLPRVTQPRVPIDLENLDERFLNIKPTNEIFYTNQNNIQLDVNEFTDFTPFSTITLVDSQHDLQVYYENLNDKLKSSAPNTIQLDFGVAEDKEEVLIGGADGVELIDRRLTLPEGVNIGYAYYVLSWNDVDNEYETWDDVTADHPSIFSRLISKQEDNLYKIGVVNEKSLKHSYGSAGIKKIKVVMFNYQINDNNPNLVEPIRWKLVTVRHFLDIPKNKYPEFGELGGDDYITIPWPYTSAVIGGVSENSKYTKSIEKTLSGGKIVEEDIVDETFLIDAQNNTELGENIEQMDLEQLRFFNKPFDMHKLLNIQADVADTFIDPDNPFGDLTPEFIATLPFPQYFEEVNTNPEYDDIINTLDPVAWNDFGRPDIQCALVAFVLGNTVWLETGELQDSIFGCVDYTYPERVYDWIENNEIPSGEGEEQPLEYYSNLPIYSSLFYPYTSGSYWDGGSITSSFSKESSVGQIFINDNLDLNIKSKCQIEYNMGNIENKALYDSSGHANQGLLIGDYKIKKRRQAEPMNRDTFIKLPKKDTNNGAL